MEIALATNGLVGIGGSETYQPGIRPARLTPG
jgi:hypothetical protein